MADKYPNLRNNITKDNRLHITNELKQSINLLQDFDSNDSLEIVIADKVEKPQFSKIQKQRQNNKGSNFRNSSNDKSLVMLNGKQQTPQKTRQEMLNQFKSRIDKRVKSKNQSINIDQSLAPTQHTRSRGRIGEGYREFCPTQKQKIIELQKSKQQEKQSKPRQYQFKVNAFSNKNRNSNNQSKEFMERNSLFNNRNHTKFASKNEGKSAHKIFNGKPKQQINLIQTRLPVIHLEQSSTSKVRMPKPGESIYQPRKKYTKPQDEKPFKPSGRQYSIIDCNRFNQYSKSQQVKKLQQEQKQIKQNQQKVKQNQERLKKIQQTFSVLLGLTGENNSSSINNLNSYDPQDQAANSNNEEEQIKLKNLDMLEQIENQEEREKYRNEEAFFLTEEEKRQQQRKIIIKPTFGLNQVVKPYDTTHAFPFVKAILGYKFGPNLQISSKKKVSNTFSDHQTYKKVFHYLVINECISDLHQRMQKLQKNEQKYRQPQSGNLFSKLKIEIKSMTKLSNGLCELKICQIPPISVADKKTDLSATGFNRNNSSIPLLEPTPQPQQAFLLKNYSISKNRIGIITNCNKFSLNNFGINSHSSKSTELKYTFLCLLKSPQSKQQLKQAQTKVQAVVSVHQLDQIHTVTKSRECYFYDLQKLSSNIRQYISISHLQYSQLSPYIYNPKYVQQQYYLHNLIDHRIRQQLNCSILPRLQQKYNKTQFQAIRQMSLRQNGIVLLQGPPGTGKTSTLLGLVSVQYEYNRIVGNMIDRKIMICAPSNAAIDHIAKRIKREGLINSNGQHFHPKLLRMGIVETDDPDILSCSLDHICERKAIELKNKELFQSNMTTIEIREHLIKLQKEIKHLNYQNNRRVDANRESEFQEKKELQKQIKEKNNEYVRYESLLYSFRKQKIIRRKLYQELQSKLMQEAQIIITTLNSSGNQKMEQLSGKITSLIVDQAAQAIQPELLIALQSGVTKVMLVGDPYQLPATTLSQDSNGTLFNRSLFQRFIDSGIRPYFLNVQYRMASMIRQFPSAVFYQNRLADGENIAKRQTPLILKPFSNKRSVIFIDVKNGVQKAQDSSYMNIKQASVISRILKRWRLLQEKKVQQMLSIGIITPYQAQRKLLMKELGSYIPEKKGSKQKNSPLKQPSKNNEQTNCSVKSKQSPQKDSNQSPSSSLMINTIDSFQGQQKDLIFISTVRSNDNRQVGFLIDERRINVAITRAKHSIIIVGNGDTLGSNEIWNEYLNFIEYNKLYFQINSYEDQFQLAEKLFDPNFYNTQSIRRRHYGQKKLSSDPRKFNNLKEMSKQDFMVLKNENNYSKNWSKNCQQLKPYKSKYSKGQHKLHPNISMQNQKSETFSMKQEETININKDNRQSNCNKDINQNQNNYIESQSMRNYNKESQPNQKDRSYDNFVSKSVDNSFNKDRGRQFQTKNIKQKNSSSLSLNFLQTNQKIRAHPSMPSDMQYQSEQLLKKKRKQQNQINQFEQQCQRLKKLQKQKQTDQFYKYLFQ